jgi:hypothetical protein
MLVNGINYKRLSFLTARYKKDPALIPQKPGMYFWIFFPDFDPKTISINDFRDLMIYYTNSQPFFFEKIKGRYKYQGVIYENRFNFDFIKSIQDPNATNIESKTIFSLSTEKENKLLNELQSNRSHMEYFHSYFKELCFYRPFYVGKADNLFDRLEDHFNDQTEVVPEIKRRKIKMHDIFLGYKTIPTTMQTDLNVILEEIFSKTVKPGLTLKPN